MNNIDPILFLQPVASLLIGAIPLVYMKLRYRTSLWASLLIASAAAYFSAIAAKVVLQYLTVRPLTAMIGQGVPLAIYFGVQTSIFEVGLAYLMIRYTSRKTKLDPRDGEFYGLGLAFWENGVYLGALSLINLLSIYLILQSNSALAEQTYKILMSTNPALFELPGKLLVPVAVSAVERISSLLAHFSWGTLVTLAVLTKRIRYLLYALPMGLVDTFAALYQFHMLGLLPTEAVVFVWSLACLIITLVALRSSYITLLKNQTAAAPA